MYSGVRNPSWAVYCEETGRKWIHCEVEFTVGPQAGQWSSLVIEGEFAEPAYLGEIYKRVVSGEFGEISGAPVRSEPIQMNAEKSLCIDVCHDAGYFEINPN